MKKLVYLATMVAFVACAGNAQNQNDEAADVAEEIEAPAVDEVTATKHSAFTEGVIDAAETVGFYVGEGVDATEEFIEENTPRVVEAAKAAYETGVDIATRGVEIAAEAAEATAEGYQRARQE